MINAYVHIDCQQDSLCPNVLTDSISFFHYLGRLIQANIDPDNPARRPIVQHEVTLLIYKLDCRLCTSSKRLFALWPPKALPPQRLTSLCGAQTGVKVSRCSQVEPAECEEVCWSTVDSGSGERRVRALIAHEAGLTGLQQTTVGVADDIRWRSRRHGCYTM